MKKILGRDLAVWVEDDSTGGLKRLAHDRSCTIEISAVTKDISGKTLGKWIRRKVIRLSWSITSSNLYTQEGFDYLFERINLSKPVVITFSPVRKTVYGETWDDTKRYLGEAYITDLGVTGNIDDVGQISIEFSGSGPLHKIDYPESDRIFDYTFNETFE